MGSAGTLPNEGYPGRGCAKVHPAAGGVTSPAAVFLPESPWTPAPCLRKSRGDSRADQPVTTIHANVGGPRVYSLTHREPGRTQKGGYPAGDSSLHQRPNAGTRISLEQDYETGSGSARGSAGIGRSASISVGRRLPQPPGYDREARSAANVAGGPGGGGGRLSRRASGSA